MKILVINSGSSSIKFQVFGFDGDRHSCIAKGIVQRIGDSAATFTCKVLDPRPGLTNGSGIIHLEQKIPNHETAIKLICDAILHGDHAIIEDAAELHGIGHRVVHGGEEFYKSVQIDGEVLAGIERCARLAPLHNPPAIMGIKACKTIFGDLPQVAVFDTAFHHTIPKHVYLYGLPIELYEKHGIRKYGFHGTSHRYVAMEAARYLERPLDELRLVTCHLGSGCSVTAVKFGQSIDTSMGMTPLGGVMMGTRSGDMDPYIPLYLVRELGMPIDDVTKTLNRSSGLEGICKHADVRDVEALAAKGDGNCQLALDMFAYRIARYVGGYAMVLGGLDAVVFTGGVGENDGSMRKRILAGAEFLGMKVDDSLNGDHNLCITTADSPVKGLVVPANEELMIALDTAGIIAALPTDSGKPVGV